MDETLLRSLAFPVREGVPVMLSEETRSFAADQEVA